MMGGCRSCRSGGRDRGHGGGYSGGRGVWQRSVFAGWVDVHAAEWRSSGWARRCGPERGQDTYLGIYFWKTAIRSCACISGPLARLRSLAPAIAAGRCRGDQADVQRRRLDDSFQQNGATRIVGDRQLADGRRPGLMTFGAATADNWSGAAPEAPRRRRAGIRLVGRCRGCRGRWCCRTTVGMI